MDPAPFGARLARRWWVVAALAALTVLGAAVATVGRADQHRTTIQFVLRPNDSVSNDDLPGTLDALKADSPLVHTVAGVLSSSAMLRRAGADADVTPTRAYSIESTVQPGSTLIDSTLTGPDRTLVNRLSAGYARAASNYIAASYSAYALERLSTDADDGGTGPGTVQVLILAFLVGSALGVALVAGELRLEPSLRRLFARGGGPAPDVAREPDVAAKTRPKAKTAPKPAPKPPPKPSRARKPAAAPKRGARSQPSSPGNGPGPADGHRAPIRREDEG
jgi:hypothetical protein